MGPSETLDERWQLDPATKDDLFKLKACRTTYVLSVNWRKNVNVSPCSPDPLNCESNVGETYKNTEARFQINFKTKLLQDILDSPVDLWAGYTRQSFWRSYDSTNSRPFRETSDQPEAWLTQPLKVGPDWLQLRMVNLGIVHESNAQADPLSRSWGRVYANLGLVLGDLSLYVKPWVRVSESGPDDNNPDISDYAGRIELQAVHTYRAKVFSAKLRNNLKFSSGTPNRYVLEADWAFPVDGALHGYVRGFSGCADSLQNYNFRNSDIGIGIGFPLTEWR